MGIESLNSAAAAAGFAMVSDDVVDETFTVYETSHGRPAATGAFGAPAANLPALIDTSARNSAAAIGARVTGLLDAWRSKG